MARWQIAGSRMVRAEAGIVCGSASLGAAPRGLRAAHGREVRTQARQTNPICRGGQNRQVILRKRVMRKDGDTRSAKTKPICEPRRRRSAGPSMPNKANLRAPPAANRRTRYAKQSQFPAFWAQEWGSSGKTKPIGGGPGRNWFCLGAALLYPQPR